MFSHRFHVGVAKRQVRSLKRRGHKTDQATRQELEFVLTCFEHVHLPLILWSFDPLLEKAILWYLSRSFKVDEETLRDSQTTFWRLWVSPLFDDEWLSEPRPGHVGQVHRDHRELAAIEVNVLQLLGDISNIIASESSCNFLRCEYISCINVCIYTYIYIYDGIPWKMRSLNYPDITTVCLGSPTVVKKMEVRCVLP